MIVTKDPDAILDFRWDWTAWLGDGDTITSAAVTLTPAGDGDLVLQGTVTHTAVAAVAWISGGTAGATYHATCRIMTDLGRTDDRTIQIVCTQR